MKPDPNMLKVNTGIIPFKVSFFKFGWNNETKTAEEIWGYT